jgi:hypothetical protein
MTLNEAIEKLLRLRGRQMTTAEIASELNKNKWYQKGDGSLISAYQIHGRTRKYPNIFDRNGSIVILTNRSTVQSQDVERLGKYKTENNKSSKTDSDENYVLDLCDKTLRLRSSRQHKFDFLIGDTNSLGKSKRLPVDAFYQDIDLVIEYRERQHSEKILFFDKPNKVTVSGVHRGEQRRIYDQRRREILPKHGIQLIEISYSDFNHDRQKKIIRDLIRDLEIVKMIIKQKNSS